MILRFRKSERSLHWALALPFVVCWLSALILVLVYISAPERPLRWLFSTVHVISGICLIVLPIRAILRNLNDVRTHLSNIAQAWIWTLHDFRWLALMGLAAISKRVELPEQGKFNAAEKLNFMTVMTTWPLFVLTGVVLLLPGAAYTAWRVHFALAALVTPLMLGHIFMATVNPGTRPGLSGMISGFVDRTWAKHHYGRWYRERFEQSEVVPVAERLARAGDRIEIRCPSCRVRIVIFTRWLLRKLNENESVACPNCKIELPPATILASSQLQDGGTASAEPTGHNGGEAGRAPPGAPASLVRSTEPAPGGGAIRAVVKARPGAAPLPSGCCEPAGALRGAPRQTMPPPGRAVVDED